MKMRIYAVSDLHGKRDRISRIRENISNLRPDVLVIAGDITNYTDSLSVIKDLNDMPIPVLAVRGNTDLSRVETLLERASNISSLHLNKVELQGVAFAGASGTIPIPFYSKLCLFEKRIIEKIGNHLEKETVFVAHPPPRGILDEAFGRFHAGSAGLYNMIVERQPRIFLCGHIHERPGWRYVGETLVVNCNMGEGRGGALVTYDGKKDVEVVMLS
ncbi:MAG: metallophosphoesterase family protein [Deltaproteobacteria bacterium]|nr:metallophosphoesterase family protein [Deltaproteobacteria bacterium]